MARDRAESFRKAVAEAIGAGARFEDVAEAFSTERAPFHRATISRWMADSGPLGEQFRGWVKDARERTVAEIRERVPLANLAYRVGILAEAHQKVYEALKIKTYPSEGLIRSLLSIQKEAAEEIGDRVEKKELTGADGAPLIAGFEDALEKAYGPPQSDQPA